MLWFTLLLFIDIIILKITGFIAQIEVVTDRITSICYNEVGRSLAIVIIESVKGSIVIMIILYNLSNYEIY